MDPFDLKWLDSVISPGLTMVQFQKLWLLRGQIFMGHPVTAELSQIILIPFNFLIMVYFNNRQKV